MYVVMNIQIFYLDNFVALSHLIEAGADPNTQSGDGKTGLHFAARQGFKENLQFLVESVGNIEFLEDIEGQTALFSAVEGDHIECASYLLEIGATVNHVNRERRRYKFIHLMRLHVYSFMQ